MPQIMYWGTQKATPHFKSKEALLKCKVHLKVELYRFRVFVALVQSGENGAKNPKLMAGMLTLSGPIILL